MSIALAVAIYFVVWWVCLFMVLPFNIRTQEESGAIVPGTPESAPAKFAILKVIVINTLIASVVFVIIWFALRYDWFGFVALENKMLN